MMRSPPRPRAAGYRAAISCFGPQEPIPSGHQRRPLTGVHRLCTNTVDDVLGTPAFWPVSAAWLAGRPARGVGQPATPGQVHQRFNPCRPNGAVL